MAILSVVLWTATYSTTEYLNHPRDFATAGSSWFANPAEFIQFLSTLLLFVLWFVYLIKVLINLRRQGRKILGIILCAIAFIPLYCLGAFTYFMVCLNGLGAIGNG